MVLRLVMTACSTLLALLVGLRFARAPLGVGGYPNGASPNSWWWEVTLAFAMFNLAGSLLLAVVLVASLHVVPKLLRTRALCL